MIPNTVNVPVFSTKETFYHYFNEICIKDQNIINRTKKSKPLQILEVNDFDKYSRCGKNFMKAVYAVASKSKIGIAEAEHFCSMVLILKMFLSIECLNHHVTNSKFFMRCWNDEQSLKNVIQSL